MQRNNTKFVEKLHCIVLYCFRKKKICRKKKIYNAITQSSSKKLYCIVFEKSWSEKKLIKKFVEKKKSTTQYNAITQNLLKKLHCILLYCFRKEKIRRKNLSKKKMYNAIQHNNTKFVEKFALYCIVFEKKNSKKKFVEKICRKKNVQRNTTQ